jgi:hypothetical protein
VCSAADSPQTRKQSIEFVERATEMIFLGAAIKPYRTVEVEELKQESSFSRAVTPLQ